MFPVTGDSFPGAREFGSSWNDKNSNFWLFGGNGVDGNGARGPLNDLWQWDGVKWTWISGSSIHSQPGNYGSINQANATNFPGARYGAVSWIDSNNHFYLFGGNGADSNGDLGSLNDLWVWDGVNWTWVSGSKSINQLGNYGLIKQVSATNMPGSRYHAISWIDNANHLWLFGGWGRDINNKLGSLNDLWRWDGNNWTWISGSNVVDKSGIYGSKRITDPGNTPGSRHSAVSWVDSNEQFWLFGGLGFDINGTSGSLSDLWRWDGSSWTWISGENITQPSVTTSGIYREFS